MNERNDEIEVDLRELALTLISKAWIIIFCAIIFSLVSFIINTFVITPQYKSETKIYVLSKQNEASITYSDLQMGSQLTKDYQELIVSRPVLENVIIELKLKENYESLKKKVDVKILSDTRIISIAVSNESPYEAMKIANLIREYSADQIATVMDIKAVNVVEEASLPTKPSSPRVMKNTVIGGLIGFIFVSTILVLRFIIDDTIKSQEDIERRLGISTLAMIPLQNQSKPQKRKKKKE